MFTDLELLQIKNHINKILHVPGNYTGGILEMVLVVDYQVSKEELQCRCSQIFGMLKKQNEIFRNVRLNLIKWVGKEDIRKELSAMAYIQMGQAFSDYEEGAADNEKRLETLLAQLKLFYARSKLVLILTDGGFVTEDKKAAQEALQPFLSRKLLLIRGKEQIPGSRLLLQMIQEEAAK